MSLDDPRSQCLPTTVRSGNPSTIETAFVYLLGTSVQDDWIEARLLHRLLVQTLQRIETSD